MADRPLAWTLYGAANRPRGEQRRGSWADLSRLVRYQLDAHGTKAERTSAGKGQGPEHARCPLWSPAELETGSTRADANVIAVHALVLDFDGAGVSLAEAADRFPGYARAGHTSWSHTEAAPRCRLVLPLLEPVPGRLWKATYARVLELPEAAGADPATVDPSRAYFLPAVGAGGRYQATDYGGAWLDLRPLVAAVEELERREAARREAARRELAEARRTRPEVRDRCARYAAAVMARRVGDLATMGEGGRNVATFGAAVDAARLALAGALDLAPALEEIRAAALAAGLPPGEVERALLSGVLRGERDGPYDFPPPGGPRGRS